MDTTVLAAIIGALATLIAAGITTYAFWRKKHSQSESLGEWVAEWVPEGEGKITSTRIILKLSSDGRVSGTGQGGDSTYVIEGFSSPFANAFAYRGLDLHKEKIVGVFIVKSWPDDRMTGSWYQLSANNELEHGAVNLRRP